ncbi:MAG: hypothetical protein BMS9Abin09_0798 [Gammaproteobacteria bacterium]|nr:MAG: hypothetical protein BMS9Abin09_0798 [Gammaproteobacteria bacterium]
MYLKAARQNDANSQKNLGIAYSDGIGSPKDYVRAFAWLNVASANGNKSALLIRNEVMQRMTREQIVQGQALTNNLLEELGR